MDYSIAELVTKYKGKSFLQILSEAESEKNALKDKAAKIGASEYVEHLQGLIFFLSHMAVPLGIGAAGMAQMRPIIEHLVSSGEMPESCLGILD